MALLAQFYIDQQRNADAIAALQRAADGYPEVAPWLRLRLIDLNADPVANVARIIADAPTSSAATIARIRLPGIDALAGNTVDMPYAYVVYDHARASNVQLIRSWLLQQDIHLAGRYSEWEYYNSDHAFIAGKKAAEQVLAALPTEREKSDERLAPTTLIVGSAGNLGRDIASA